MYVYSNHDDRRSISRIKGSIQKAKLLALFKMTARGVAVTYQGEEFGMSDTKIPRRKGKDPIAQMYKIPQFIVNKLPLLINRDECRTPMQWNSSANAGFSSEGVTTWLPINENYQKVNAAKAMSDSSSLIQTYKQLLALRKNCDCIKFGDLQLIADGVFPKKILVFERIFNEKRALIIINFSKKKYEINIPPKYKNIIYTTTGNQLKAKSKMRLNGYDGLVLTNY